MMSATPLFEDGFNYKDEQEPVTNPASSLHSMRVFPMKNERPLVKGWQAAPQISMDQVEAWSAQFPGCGWGAAVDTGVLVVDCDSDSAAAAFTGGGEIPSTLTTLTHRCR